jgi:hypothetical protein
MKLKFALFSVALIVMLTTTSFSQNMSIAADNAITNELRQEGVKYETRRAVLWVEKGSLTEEEIKEFGSLVNQGIIDIEKYSGIKFDNKYYQTEKVEYFISSKVIISHGSMDHKPFIYFTAARVKAKTIPYLHETTHIIVWESLKSLWLQEGFASHVQTYVSKHYGGYAGSPFNPENKDIDQLARELLKSEPGKKVLPLIGLNGTPLTMKNKEQSKIYTPIMTDRKVAAPVFYNLSESFVKFLVEKVGMKKMRKIFEAQDTRAGIEEVTGKSVDEWKAEWLKSLAA